MEKYNIILNKKAKKLIKIFNIISIIISFIGLLVLFTYNTFYISINLYKSSIIIFRTSLFTLVFSIICGIFFSNVITRNKCSYFKEI